MQPATRAGKRCNDWQNVQPVPRAGKRGLIFVPDWLKKVFFFRAVKGHCMSQSKKRQNSVSAARFVRYIPAVLCQA